MNLIWLLYDSVYTSEMSIFLRGKGVQLEHAGWSKCTPATVGSEKDSPEDGLEMKGVDRCLCTSVQ